MDKNICVIHENDEWLVPLRESFKTRTHKRLIDIVEPTPQTVEALMKLDLASGVNIEIKI